MKFTRFFSAEDSISSCFQILKLTVRFSNYFEPMGGGAAEDFLSHFLDALAFSDAFLPILSMWGKKSETAGIICRRSKCLFPGNRAFYFFLIIL
jgi:hypothetical protein